MRLKIWGYVARTRRLLELQYCIVDRKFFTFQSLPSILHTSQESRGVGLCYYHLSFGTDKHPPDTYFNSADDIIYFGSEQYGDEIDYMIQYFHKQSNSFEPRDRIQNLALAEYLWQRDYKYSPFASWRGTVISIYLCLISRALYPTYFAQVSTRPSPSPRKHFANS